MCSIETMVQAHTYFAKGPSCACFLFFELSAYKNLVNIKNINFIKLNKHMCSKGSKRTSNFTCVRNYKEGDGTKTLKEREDWVTNIGGHPQPLIRTLDHKP